MCDLLKLGRVCSLGKVSRFPELDEEIDLLSAVISEQRTITKGTGSVLVLYWFCAGSGLVLDWICTGKAFGFTSAM